MKLPAFEYAAPSSVQAVVELLASRPGEARILAGGQSLLPTMAFRLAQPALLVDLRNVDGLGAIDIDRGAVVLGARVRWRDIEDDRRLREAHPLLAQAVRHIAHYQVRNRGTVGGSLAHADPAAELPCIAVTCEGEVRVLGCAGERCIPAAQFFTAPLATALAEDEMILDLRLPAWPPARRWSFREFARRSGDFALAGVAVYFDLDPAGRASHTHIGVVGACHVPHRLARAERALDGAHPDAATIHAAAATAAAEIDPPDDFHASADYRRALVATILQDALLEAARGHGSEGERCN